MEEILISSCFCKLFFFANRREKDFFMVTKTFLFCAMILKNNLSK